MKACFQVGLYRQGLLHDLSNTDGQSFVWGVDITREPEVRIMQSGRKRGIPLPGCIIKGAISIIMNTGLITERMVPCSKE